MSLASDLRAQVRNEVAIQGRTHVAWALVQGAHHQGDDEDRTGAVRSVVEDGSRYRTRVATATGGRQCLARSCSSIAEDHILAAQAALEYLQDSVRGGPALLSALGLAEHDPVPWSVAQEVAASLDALRETPPVHPMALEGGGEVADALLALDALEGTQRPLRALAILCGLLVARAEEPPSTSGA